MKRRLLISAICLLLGAVANVAVAWGCAAFVHGVLANGGRWIEWIRRDDPRAIDLAVSGDPDIVGVQEFSGYGYASLRVFGYWSIVGGNTGPTTLDYHSARAGLPLRCFVGRHQFASADQVDGYVGAWPVPRRVGPLKMNRLGFLPLHPIWPGFALNTLFYAAILWLLAWGASALRRFLRMRRGLCPKCVYPMGESAVCTECGGLLPKRVAT